jgi:hypothetical protein
LQQLAAQGWLSLDRVNALAPYSGTPAELVAPLQNAAYTNLQTRLLMRLFDSPTFSQADLKRVLTEHGMRPADQTAMLNALPYLATQSQRTQLQSTLESAYAKGVISEADLVSDLDALQQNVSYPSLVTLRTQWERQIAMVGQLEASYIMMAEAGVIDLPTLQSSLLGIGLDDPWVNNKLAVAQNKLTATAFRKAAATELRLETATTNEERKAALKNFAAGNTDAIALAAQLVLTGLTPVQAVAWVDIAQLSKQGSQHSIYGLMLNPAQAQLLRSRVTALADQRRKALITDAQMIAQLGALGIPSNWINAINSAAAANIDVVGAPVLVPVSTQ